MRRVIRTAACLVLPLASCDSHYTLDDFPSATPIKHLVVIYGENVSFDHYFGTYPEALNPPGEPHFIAVPGTPAVDGLTPALLNNNPNLNPANGAGASNPFRLDRSEAATADQDHGYTAEQRAYDGGAADLFPRYTGRAGLVMGYYDGNTVTALWNYAQHFAMSDNAYGDQYGPSTPGAVTLISGQTNDLMPGSSVGGDTALADGQGGFTLIGDLDPAGDTCSGPASGSFAGRNIGDLLNDAGISWGWFEGGFDLTRSNDDGSTGCARRTLSGVTHVTSRDYVPHHQPFQYYASTANSVHARPPSPSSVGLAGDAANHQYDLRDFFAAVQAGNFPAVSFLKASAFQDAHAGYSDPLDEQAFIVQVVNFLEQRPEWKSTAVVIAYDDSDGWYDHRFAAAQNGSFDPRADQLTAPGACGTPGVTPRAEGAAGKGPVNGRCGPGPRLPFLVISPWARRNHVDHALLIQSSVLRFIEDNWLGGERLGGGSFDAQAGNIEGLFDFQGRGDNPVIYLDESDGTVVPVPSGRLPP